MIKIRFGILIGSPSPSINGIFLRARKAEENSFDSLWIADHLLSFTGPCPEAWSILVALATTTNKLLLGTAVSDPHRRNPALLAQTVVTIDQISGGRVNCWFRSGGSYEFRPFWI